MFLYFLNFQVDVFTTMVFETSHASLVNYGQDSTLWIRSTG